MNVMSFNPVVTRRPQQYSRSNANINRPNMTFTSNSRQEVLKVLACEFNKTVPEVLEAIKGDSGEKMLICARDGGMDDFPAMVTNLAEGLNFEIATAALIDRARRIEGLREFFKSVIGEDVSQDKCIAQVFNYAASSRLDGALKSLNEMFIKKFQCPKKGLYIVYKGIENVPIKPGCQTDKGNALRDALQDMVQ